MKAHTITHVVLLITEQSLPPSLVPRPTCGTWCGPGYAELANFVFVGSFVGKITSGCKSRDHFILKPLQHLPFLQAAAGRKLVLYPGPHVERDVGLGTRLTSSLQQLAEMADAAEASI